MTDTLRTALYSIPANDRDIWVLMGMAVKSELGEGGFDLWDAWSRQSDRYNVADAKAVWRSIRPGGGVTIGTLYHEAKKCGWQGKGPVLPKLSEEEKEVRRRHLEEEKRRIEKRAQQAACTAETMLQQACFGPHPYLERKGFPEVHGLILDEQLLVPMRDFRTYKLQSLQLISEDGAKKFLPGGRASHAVYKMLGNGGERWYCEGYATGLSIVAALRHLYRDRQSEAWVCFSAANIPKVALSQRRSYVITDHDLNGVGEKYARKTGLPYWLPPEVGDANDFHQRYGVEALAEELRKMLL